MIYRTLNCMHLEALSEEERAAVEKVTHHPKELAERANLLLSDFFDRFIETNKSIENIRRNATFARAFMIGILDILDELQKMLEECQNIVEFIE